MKNSIKWAYKYIRESFFPFIIIFLLINITLIIKNSLASQKSINQKFPFTSYSTPHISQITYNSKNSTLKLTSSYTFESSNLKMTLNTLEISNSSSQSIRSLSSSLQSTPSPPLISPSISSIPLLIPPIIIWTVQHFITKYNQILLNKTLLLPHNEAKIIIHWLIQFQEGRELLRRIYIESLNPETNMKYRNQIAGVSAESTSAPRESI